MFFNRPAIAAVEAVHDDRRVLMAWADRPELPWRQSEDFRVKNNRRKVVNCGAACGLYVE
jgi:hypothetical protein